MRITDAQVHIWRADSPTRPWPSDGAARAHRDVPFELTDLVEEMDAAGVDRVVIVPPSWEGYRNDLGLAAAAEYPDRFAVMGRIDIEKPSLEDFSTWREQPGMLGVRLALHIIDRIDVAEWFWPKAASAELPVMVFAPGHTSEFGEVARRYGDLRVIIDHLNIKSGTTTDGLKAAIEPLLPLSDLDNVAVKVSGLPCFLGEGESIATLTPHIRRVVDAFGPERCMWGSDLTRLPCPYSEWVDAGRTGFGFLNAADTEQLMGEAAATWLRWP